MANRSYLYSIDFDSTKKDNKEGKAIGLSEYAYAIPLSYMILVSQDTKLSNSIIWEYENPIALVGDFEKGEKRLFALLDILLKKGIFNRDLLEKARAETKEFLDTHKSKYILLECGEIFEMDDEDIVTQNEDLYENLEMNIKEEVDLLVDLQEDINVIDAKIAKLSKPKNFLVKLFSKNSLDKIKLLEEEKKEIENEMWQILGIDNWTDVLYYN